MSYQGTASTAPNPPNCLSAFMGATPGGGARVWFYRSTHVHLTDVSSTGFFIDGADLGMQLGDPVFVIGTTTYVMSAHCVNIRTSTGVGLTAGLLVSSAS